MPSEPSLVLLRASRNWLPLLGHSSCLLLLLLCAFLSGNVAISSHVLYGSFAGVPHSGQRFCVFGVRQPASERF